MTEIFSNISERRRAQIEFVVQMLFIQNDLFSAYKLLKEYSNLCTDEEKEFLDFYFNLKMEDFKRESNNDQR